jgi:hypothetical protein
VPSMRGPSGRRRMLGVHRRMDTGVSRRFSVGETVDLHRQGTTREAIIRSVTRNGYSVAVRTKRGWSHQVVHISNLSTQAWIGPPAAKPTDEQLSAARVAVDRAIRSRLDAMPCFCTPERPELGREAWCAKHWVLGRLDRDALAADVQQAMEIEA